MDRYDVILQAVDDGVDREEAVHAAAVVLGLDPRGAWSALEVLPAKVLEDVDERSAEELLGPLRRAGWRVRLLKRRRASYPSSPHGLEPASRHPSSPSRHPSSPQGALQPAARPTPYQGPAPGASSWPPATGVLQGGAQGLDAPLLPLPELELDYPPPAPSPIVAPPISVRAPAAPEPAPRLEGESLVAFFAGLPRSLLVPLRGGGVRWLARSAVLALGFSLLGLGAVGLALGGSLVGLGAVVLFGLAGTAFWTGHLFAWFRACLWAVVGGDDGPDPPSPFDTDDMFARFFDGLGVIALFAVVNVGVVFSSLDLLRAGDPGALSPFVTRVLVANVILMLHLPIGLSLMAVRHSALAYFDVIAALKLVIGAPIHLLVVLVVWAFASRVSGAILEWAVPLVVAIDPAAGTPVVSWPLLAAVSLLALALTLLQWGVLGAAMGAVCRAKPALVE